MVNYATVHARLRKAQGPASSHVCRCGQPADDWAYQYLGFGAEQRSGTGAVCTEDPRDYAAMCGRCHRELDLERDPGMAERITANARKNGERLAERMRKDPTFAAERRSLLKRNSEGHVQRMREDPDYAASVTATLRRSGEAHSKRMREDPDYAARVLAPARAASTARHRCHECGLVSVSSGVKRHQVASGHTGRSPV